MDNIKPLILKIMKVQKNMGEQLDEINKKLDKLQKNQKKMTSKIEILQLIHFAITNNNNDISL